MNISSLKYHLRKTENSSTLCKFHERRKGLSLMADPFWRSVRLSLRLPPHTMVRAQSFFSPARTFRAEKCNEHAWTFLPRSPGRVWKNGGISNILLPKNKMFPLITWKEQAICLQKLQAVVITLSLLNFLEEYLMVNRTLTTLISLRCTGNVHA